MALNTVINFYKYFLVYGNYVLTNTKLVESKKKLYIYIQKSIICSLIDFLK